MMKVFFSLIIVFCSLVTSAQYDHTSSGRALQFDGIDDYIDLGNIYDDLQLPVTVSAWVYFDPAATTQYPIFASQDNTLTYTGFTFVVSPVPHIGFTIGDGRGSNNPAYRRSRAGYFQEIGRWVHVAAVAISGDNIHTFINGQDVSGEYQGSSTYPMESNAPADKAKIGTFFGNNVYYWFKGLMDEVRVWNRALSAEEIRASMCKKLRGDEPGLIGYWNFDETSGNQVMDLSPNAFHGTIKGNPVRVFSGAPVGDESEVLYTTSWQGKSLTMDDLSVSNISQDAFGVHIYRVNEPPSRIAGLPVDFQTQYYGIFLADDSPQSPFDFYFPYCTYERIDNSEGLWYETKTQMDVRTRVEIIATTNAQAAFDVDLGENLTLCDASSATLTAHPDPSGKMFEWSTGETSNEIVVKVSGSYLVKVTGACTEVADTIDVLFDSSPPAFSLGEDELLCSLSPMILEPDLEKVDGLSFTWQDGSQKRSFLVEDFGTYWLRIENGCGYAVDSVTIDRRPMLEPTVYNFFSPNSDSNNPFFAVVGEELEDVHVRIYNRWGKLVFESRDYGSDWDGGDLPAGVYFYSVAGKCIQPTRGAVTIMR